MGLPVCVSRVAKGANFELRCLRAQQDAHVEYKFGHILAPKMLPVASNARHRILCDTAAGLDTVRNVTTSRFRRMNREKPGEKSQVKKVCPS